MSGEYLNDNVGFALSAAIAELSKRPCDDPVGFVVKWLRLAADATEDADERNLAKARTAELRPSVMEELVAVRNAKLAAQKRSTGWMEDLEVLDHYLSGIFTFPASIWSDVLNDMLRIFPGLSAAYISKRELVDEKHVFRNIASSDGFPRLDSIEDDPAGLLSALFPEEGPLKHVFIPNVLSDPRFSPGHYTAPGSLLLISMVLQNRLSLEAVGQLIADPEAEIPTVPSYFVATFTTVNGSGDTLTGAVREGISRICSVAAAAYLRCDDNLLRRQVQFMTVTQNEEFGVVNEILESTESKFDLAKLVIVQPEWESLLSEIFVTSQNNEKIAAAFVFTLRAATEEELNAEPGKLSWSKLKAAVGIAGKSAANFQVTGPRPGIPQEHTLKSIEALLPPLGSDEPIAIRLMHAFVTQAISERKADVASRREALGPDQKPVEVDADFE